jgi:hypothetical protein
VIIAPEIIPSRIVVEASFASAVIPSEVIARGVVVMGERGRREDQHSNRRRQHQHHGSTHLLPLCASVA